MIPMPYALELHSPDDHPYAWLALRADGSVSFGNMRPTTSPSIVYEHWRPSPSSAGTGFRMENLISGAIEEFVYDGTHWYRNVQLSPLSSRPKPQNGAKLVADGSVRLEHDGSILRRDEPSLACDVAEQRRFSVTNSQPPVFRIEHDQGLWWEYTYINDRWHVVLPETHAVGRKFLLTEENKDREELILTSLPVAMPESGEQQIGPVTLYANGHIEFADTLYRRGKPVPNHEHLGVVATRPKGAWKMLAIRHLKSTDTVDELPVLLRYEWQQWRRYVLREPTLVCKVKHYFREAIVPLLRVVDLIQIAVRNAFAWSFIVCSCLFFLVFLATVIQEWVE